MTLDSLPITQAYRLTPVIRMMMLSRTSETLEAVILPYPTVVTVMNIQQSRVPYSQDQGLLWRFSRYIQFDVEFLSAIVKFLYIQAIKCIKNNTVTIKMATSLIHVLDIKKLLISLRTESFFNLFITFLNFMILKSFNTR